MSDEQQHQKLDFDPVLLGLCGILCGAIIVGVFHYLTIRWCNFREARVPSRAQSARLIREMSTLSTISSSTAHLLKVYVYSRELKEGTCAVCLSEFVEGEEVRILPDCAHTFHVPCVDMWLYSHPSCPLCRTCTTPRKAHVVVSLPNSGELSPPVEESVPSSGELPTPSESFTHSSGLLFPEQNSFVAL